MAIARKPRVDLWALRAPIPSGTARLLGISSVVTVFTLWCLASYLTVTRGTEVGPLVPHFFLPPPDEVLKALVQLVVQQDLLGSIWVSAQRILLAMLCSVAIALPLGILMGSFEVVNRFFDPIVAPMRYLPITAFIPLTILWFSLGETQKIFFLFLGTFTFLLPAIVDAIRAVPDELVQTSFTLGASRGQVIRTVLIPAVLPQVFDSFRVMNAIAWTYIILAELIGAEAGIGYLLDLSGDRFKTSWTFALILVVGVIGILTDVGLRGLNRLVFRWREIDV